MKHTPLLAALLIIWSITIAHAQNMRTERIIDKWEFRKAGDKKWEIANVPGCVHTDLLDNLLIPDPFYGTNEQYLQWIDSCDWEYRSILNLSAAEIDQKHLTLIFEGLDTYADVFVNGQKLLHADNMFRQWEIPCKEYLRAGENELLVHFYSVTKEAKKLYKKLKTPLPYDERVMVRKAAYQFGWDWAPRLVTMGIWRPVTLESRGEIKINDFSYSIQELTTEKAVVNFNCELLADAESKYTLSLWQTGSLEQKAEIKTLPGINHYQFRVVIEKPELWWPNGMGNQTLYDFSVICMRGNKLCDEKTTAVGLRKVELIREDDSVGQSFYFRVNGIPVFMKGANYIPSDFFPSTKRDQQVNRLLNDAVASNLNMLRVWGGGIYEDDNFYDLCDELGILVWQDFMFAGALYPGDSAFNGNVRAEITQQVTRLRNHPCIALWCGNNEIDEAWHNWGMQKQFGYSPKDSARIWTDYQKLFSGMIPEILQKSDPQRPYQSSSPLYGWGKKQSMTHGDAHYWGVWWGDEPFGVYNTKVPRFMSEYGFQGFPTLQTLYEFGPKDQLHLNSEVVLAHEKHPRGFELITNAMKRDYFVPDSLHQFAMLSQFVQANAMQTAIEAQRRARPYCMGSLYWQLNDCWPVISWAGIDYNGQWKAAQYAVKRAFQTCIISTVIKGDNVNLFGISDSLTDINGTLKTTLYDAAGAMLWSTTKEITLPAASSCSLLAFNVREELPAFDSTRTFLLSELSSGSTLLARSVKIFCKPVNYRQPKANIKYEFVTTLGNYAVITLSADQPVMGIFLETYENILAVSDNFFDLMPKEEKTLIIYYLNPLAPPLKPLLFSYFSKLR